MSKLQSQSITIQRAPHDKKNPYAQISRHMLEDKELSLPAKGLLCYLLSRVDTWVVHPRNLAENLGIGKTFLYSLLNILLEKGYATKQTVRGEKGKFSSVVYEFYEHKLPEEFRFQKKITVFAKRDTGNPDTGLRTLINNDSNNTSLEKEVIDKAQLCVIESLTSLNEKGLLDRTQEIPKPKKSLKTPVKVDHFKDLLTPEQIDTYQWLQSLGIDTPDGNLTWWAKNYSKQRLQEVYAVSKNKKSVGAYMMKLLKAKSSVASGGTITKNRRLAEQVKAERWSGLQVHQKYATYEHAGCKIELDFAMEPEQFSQYLFEKAKIYGHAPLQKSQANTSAAQAKTPVAPSNKVSSAIAEQRKQTMSSACIKEIRISMQEKRPMKLRQTPETVQVVGCKPILYDDPNFEQRLTDDWIDKGLPLDGEIFSVVSSLLILEHI